MASEARDAGDDAALTGTMTTAVGGLARLLDGAPTLAAARGISAAGLDGVYGVGRELYGTGRYDEALRSFELLCLYDHRSARNWHALGLCRRALQDYDGAAAALAFAVGEADASDPTLQLDLAECLLGAGHADAAAEALERAGAAGDRDGRAAVLAAQLREARAAAHGQEHDGANSRETG